MNPYILTYLQLITEQNEQNIQSISTVQIAPSIQKFHNFIEYKRTNITDKCTKSYQLGEIFLTEHCVKSVDENNASNIHGLNYLNIPLNKFYQAIDIIVQKIKDQVDSDILINQRLRFHIFLSFKDLPGERFLLSLESRPSTFIKRFDIFLLTIFETKQKDKSQVKTNKGQIVNINMLGELLLENKNIFLGKICL